MMRAGGMRAGGMRGATQATARGSTAQTTLAFIRHSAGEPALQRILAGLSPRERDDVVSTDLTAELPYASLFALWHAADEELAIASRDWMIDAGAFAIESAGKRLYGGLLQKDSPEEFVTQSVSLFRLYYAPGDMVAVQVEAGRAVLRLVGFESRGPIFCRRQTGGLLKAVELAGGKSLRVLHVRCEHEGDAFCEWELSWS